MSMIASPPPTAEETVPARDGTKLHVEHFLPAGPPQGVLVFTHGFSAHIGNFRHVGGAFADAGLAATFFDCRGHGKSEGRRGYVQRFSDFEDDLTLMIERAQARHPNLPLALAAHSQGATVTLDLLMRDAAVRSAVKAVGVAAPFLALKLKVPLFKLALAKVMGRMWPTLTMGNELAGEDLSRNPDVIVGVALDPLVHHAATPRWFNELRATQARVVAAAKELRTPTFMQIAGQDRIVSNDVDLAFAREAGSIVEVKVYDNLFHEMFLEPERDEVIADLVRWITGALQR
jgi:alpha-beta hydrolase superfamily lysophospholipase